MYNLIIVDDEEATRDMIARFINKSDFGFQVIGCFSNGKDALNYIVRNQVDLVITDIKMPNITGIELAENIYNTFPAIKVIIISGFGEFGYAKSAIEYNVANYLLKPIVIKEFADALERAKQLLDSEKSIITETISYEDRLSEFLNELSMGLIESKEECEKIYAKYGADFDKSQGRVLSIELCSNDSDSNWEYGKTSFLTALVNVMRNITTAYIVPLSEKNGNFIIAVIGEIVDISKIKSNIFETLNVTVQVECVFIFCNIWDLSIKLAERKTKDEKVMFLASQLLLGNTVMVKKIIDNISEDGGKEQDLIQKILTIIGIDKSESAALTENFLFDANVDTGNVIQKAKTYIEQNYQNDITRDEVANYVFMNSSYFSRYFSQKTGISFYDYLVSIRMKKAMQLLTTNAKINDICKKVGYNNAKYFAKNFKKHTTYTPSEYRQYVLKMESAANDED